MEFYPSTAGISQPVSTPEKKTKKSDKRSQTSRSNITKARQVKAEKQRLVKAEIDAFIKQTKQKYGKGQPIEEPDSEKQYESESEYESDSSSSSDIDQLVIKPRSSKKKKEKKKKTKGSDTKSLQMKVDALESIVSGLVQPAKKTRKRREKKQPIVMNINPPQPNQPQMNQTPNNPMVEEMKKKILINF